MRLRVEQAGRQSSLKCVRCPRSRCADPGRLAAAGNRRASAAGNRGPAGVSVQSISETIRRRRLGDLPRTARSLSERSAIPIRVSLIESARRDLTTLENLPVPTLRAPASAQSVAFLDFWPGTFRLGARYQSKPARVPGGGFESGDRPRTATRRFMRCLPEEFGRQACIWLKPAPLIHE